MISRSVEYALRAIVTIARENGSPCTSRQISATTRVPAPYLSKLLQGLVRSGLVRSQRGVRGGFVLSKGPGDLSIWDVVDAVEPIKRIEHCPLGITTHGTTLCPLHRRLDRAIGILEKELRETTISDLLSEAAGATLLCEETKSVRTDPYRRRGKSPKKRTRATKKNGTVG